MAGKRKFTSDPATFLVEWMRLEEEDFNKKIDDTARRLSDALRQSDQDLLDKLENQVEAKLRQAERAVQDRLADATRAENNARETHERARQLEAETNRRLRSAIRAALLGRPGPAGERGPLGDVLRARLTRYTRYRGAPPPDAWYLVQGLAFAVGDGHGKRLERAVAPDGADDFANRINAAVVGVDDRSLNNFGTAYNCTFYETLAEARDVAERHRAYVKSWATGTTREEAERYCRDTWVGKAGEESLHDWIRFTRSLTIVEVEDRAWAFDMSGGVDVASWTDKVDETFHQLLAAGVELRRGTRRRRGSEDTDAHGAGFHLTKTVLQEKPCRIVVLPDPAEGGGDSK